jgi:hypothetical protein
MKQCSWCNHTATFKLVQVNHVDYACAQHTYEYRRGYDHVINLVTQEVSPQDMYDAEMDYWQSQGTR